MGKKIMVLDESEMNELLGVLKADCMRRRGIGRKPIALEKFIEKLEWQKDNQDEVHEFARKVMEVV